MTSLRAERIDAPLRGNYGVWRANSQVDRELAQKVERLGYGSLWLGGSPDEFSAHAIELLSATESLVVGTGIASIWKTTPERAAAIYQEIEQAHPGRFILGIGPAHREGSGGVGAIKPYSALNDYLDRLSEFAVPAHRIVLAALGPRVLGLARDRTGGAHPYLVTPAHTREAREVLGSSPLLIPEQHVVLDANPETARATARESIEHYLRLVNYRRSWLRLGFTEEDFADGGSDRLIDEVIAHGSAAKIADVLREHVTAGADHVVVQVFGKEDPLDTLGALADELELIPR